MKPLMLDLCCGLGGWSDGFLAAGWRCVGVDLADFSASYPGEFVQADLLTWEGWRELRPLVVMSSPPCEEFSRWCMPWTRAKQPPQPDLSLWRRAEFIGRTLKAPLVQENVRGAQPWVGRSALHRGPFHLWGDVPAVVPDFAVASKSAMYSPRRSAAAYAVRRAERAKIPFELARYFGQVFHPRA